jgi:phosphoenolpyruvate synthase/pyruvate phosphate dikinase
MKLYVLPLSDPQASLEMVGGKGMSLAKLARAGMPVPDGFYITTAAYREFVAVSGLQPRILTALERVDAADPATFETASQIISGLFATARIPSGIEIAIRDAYINLDSQNAGHGRSSSGNRRPLPVAVRSSATAEDLPNASFAGQQETYLNIRGEDAVLEAVPECWASLWTARAIAYRLRQGIQPEGVALAVVVQKLVPAEAAGILFTANPVSGSRSEAVINAAWGLGEAVVGGLVTPDSITVDKSTGRVSRRETAEKPLMTVLTENGTAEQPVPASLMNKAVLTDRLSGELVRYGTQIEQLYGLPMDVEWALAGGKFAILQARPVTTLGEAPLEWKPPHPKGVYMRTSVVDLMPDPLSPLFASLGIPVMVAQMYPLGKYLIRMEPVLPEDYFTTINGYGYMNAHFPARGWWWILFGMLPAYPRMLRMLVPFWRDEARPRYRASVVQAQQKDPKAMTAAELWHTILAVMDAFGYYTDTLMFATMGASAGSEGLLTKVYDKMARQAGDPPATAMLMGWNNLPSRAEKSLYDLAGFCRTQELLGSYILETLSEQLAEKLNGDQLPAGIEVEAWSEFRQRFDRHLQEFGHMIFDLDFAKPLPRDQPEPMMEAIKMYLRDEGVNPYARQKASEQKRIQTTETALSRLKGFRRWVFVKALNWAQSLSEVREDALADIGLGYPVIRQMLYALGEFLVKSGALREAGDIFWLEKDEVEGAIPTLGSEQVLESMQDRVAQRKAFWQKAKAATPPPMIPFRKKYLGMKTTIWLAESEANQTGNVLKGVPTSPGRVTAPACVLHGTEDFTRMRPGDVLVAGATTPAWTPLFAMAAAVVTDIGGPLSHGSIVAREYGIPAVMGTGIATRRIRDGQTVTVDGGAGVVILEE